MFPKVRPLAIPGVLLLLGAAQVVAQNEIEVNSRWLGDRVFVTWACDYFQGTNMAVVVTDSGLVIIDTGLSPSLVRRQRALVERELGRNDFRYLINTHMHNDHAFANEVFPEATVVAHANGVAALQREVAQIPDLLERLRRGQASYREWAAASSPDSAEGKEAREGVAAFGVGIADLEAGIRPRYPTMSIGDRDTLRVGDVRFDFYSFTGLHSDSDILILLPGERMLFTGDVFWGGQLPTLGEAAVEELPRLLETWTAILDAAPDLETMVPGHSDVPLTVEDFRGMHAYFSRLRADVENARAAGTRLLSFLAQQDFKARYPEVAEYRYLRRDYSLHQHNVYMLWR